MYVCCNGLVFEWLAMISVSLLFLFANSIFVRHATTTNNLNGFTSHRWPVSCFIFSVFNC